MEIDFVKISNYPTNFVRICNDFEYQILFTAVDTIEGKEVLFATHTDNKLRIREILPMKLGASISIALIGRQLLWVPQINILLMEVK